jgi:hypothetical protein
MSAYRVDLPFIPLGGWRTQAACTRRVNEMLWDDHVEGETPKQREARHTEAKSICNTLCPVRAQCSAEVNWKVDEGIRGGHKLPTLNTHRTWAEDQMLRLLRKGCTLDEAAARQG